MNTKQVIIQSLKNIGVEVDVDLKNSSDLNLNEYIVDSIQFATFIVELEDNLHIELPYEYLSSDIMSSLDGFCRLIDELI